jgi:hypothetical protein
MLFLNELGKPGCEDTSCPSEDEPDSADARHAVEPAVRAREERGTDTDQSALSGRWRRSRLPAVSQW